MKLAPGSHNYVRLSDIRRVDTDAAPGEISSVSASIYDNTDTIVSGSTISLTAVSGESDSYEGTFPPLNLTHGDNYTVRITYVADGATRIQRIDAIADGH